MKVAVFVKASKDSEAGVLPSQELLEAMGKFNEQLVNAGVLLAGEGLKPSSQGARVRFSGKSRTVTDGPFAETNELVAGFWIWKVRSMQEAIDWVRRCPNPMREESDIEIRPLYSIEDFGDNATAEIRERESRLRQNIESSGADSDSTAPLSPTRFEKSGQRVIAGLNRTYTPQSCAGIPQQWQDFIPQIGKLSGTTGNYTYGVLWNSRPSSEFDYLVGMEVADGTSLPSGFSQVRLPAAEYAVFEHPGHVSEIPSLIERTRDRWLPASEFEPVAQIMFERYTEKFNPQTHSGGIEICVPVRKKA